MAVDLSGYWFIDSIDLWTGYKTFIEEGTADVLKYAPKKDSTEHNWDNEHGIDVDLSNPKFAARPVSLQCYIVCQSTDEFWDNHNALISQLMQPGVHSLKISSHGLDKIYYVEYRETTKYDPVKPLKLDPAYNVHAFTLVLRETEPTIDNVITRVTDDDGRFIIT